jgi:hypothetical protein
MASFSLSSPAPTPQTGWRNSPLGHTYKKFESEWNAEGSNRTKAAQYNPGTQDGSQARVIYFIERTRQLECELAANNRRMEELNRKELKNKSDVVDLRKLVNDLCTKIRKVERERDAAVKDMNTAQVSATQMSARLKTVQMDAKKYKSADSRLHTRIINLNRETSEQKLRAEKLEDELDMANTRAEEAVKEASERVASIEKKTQESLKAANQRAEEVLEELRAIQGGWQEMKSRADASQLREEEALEAARARIIMAENNSKAAKELSKQATIDKTKAEKEAAELRVRVAELEKAINSRTAEVENLRRENSRLQSSFKVQSNQMTELQAALTRSKRELRDDHRQKRVQHIKFIDRRLAVQKEITETKNNPPMKMKKKPSQKMLADKRRAEERA